MSELKAYKNLECEFNTSSQQEIVVAEDSEGGYIVFEECDEVYLKSEADKVIAELEMKLAAAQHVLRLNKPEALYSNLETMSRLTHEKYVIERRERHHKYKRCLAMARWCKRNRLNACVCGPVEKIDFWEKWHKRWLNLAEKFKEAK